MADNKKNISNEEAKNKNNESTIDALLMDLDDNDNGKTTEEPANWNEFMAEYRDIIKKLPVNNNNHTTTNETDPQEQFLKPRPAKNKQIKQEKPIEPKSDWNEEITLAPEEYEELDDGSGMLKDIPEEEPTPDFNLGETAEKNDDKFQLSINFEGEHKSAINEELPQEKKYDPDNPRGIDWVFDIAEMFVFVLAAVLIITSFFFKHAEVEGRSMLNSFEEKDHLIVSNLFYTPQRGDVIVFEDYSKSLPSSPNLYRKPVIKRVIAIEGDKVEISLSEDQKRLVIKINGEIIPDEHACYDYYAFDGLKIEHDNPLELVVEEGQVFVMGDNRYHSTDSREVGTINVDSILGKVILRFYPFDKFEVIE